MMETRSLFLLLVILVFMVGNIATCGTHNYAPCTCSSAKGEATVTCNRVPGNTVKTMFSKIKNVDYFDYLVFTPDPKDTMIPADLIGNNVFCSVTINCPSRFNPLVINPMAFNLTGFKIEYMTIQNCDLSRLNWSFTKNFRTLSSLRVAASSNLHTMFNTLPGSSLTSLTELTLTKITGMNGFANNSLKYPSVLAAGLKTVDISFCYDLSDDALDSLLTKWIVPSGMDTLSQLFITGNSLTKMPLNLPALDALKVIDFGSNMNPMKLKTGDFNFRDMGTGQLQPISYLLLDNSQIYYIEPGTFKGDFSEALVFMANNDMQLFEEGVFKEMLSQMDASTGYLNVGNVPFDCDNIQCDLMWLLVDNPNYLSSMWNAMCANGTYFSQLDPQDLRTSSGDPCPYQP